MPTCGCPGDTECTTCDEQVAERGLQANREAVGRQLSEMNKLQNGWLDGEGLRPQKGVIPFTRAVLDEAMRRGAPRAHCYPTLEGGIQVEWDEGEVVFADDGVTAIRFPPGEIVHTMTIVPQPDPGWVVPLLFDFFGWTRSQ